MRRAPLALAALAASVVASAARAEPEIAIYGGWLLGTGGEVSLDGIGLGAASGDGFAPGARITFWGEQGFGIGLDWTRLPIEGAEGVAGGLDFGSGIDVISVTGLRRWDGALGPATPYVGAGLGLALSSVAIAGAANAEDRSLGPALSLMAGAALPLAENWSAFGELRGTYAIHAAEPGGREVDGGTFANSLNLGVSFSF